MARVMSWSGRYRVLDWDHEVFYLRQWQAKDDTQDLAVNPLKVVLTEHEMQAWAQDSKGMDDKFEPDLIRPGKFKARSATGRR